MLLTITTTHQPATDLGYLLHKNPAKCQTFSLASGEAHVFYPVATEDRCTAALLLEVDPVGMVRGKGKFGHGVLGQYVNDRPYVASSLMSVAISQVLGTALNGRCKERPDLAETEIPLKATIEVLPCRGGEEFLNEVFGPLGYKVEAVRHPLDERFPEWGTSPYFSVSLTKATTLAELLTHLYVLIPVFDNYKHYYVGHDELEKLLARGEGWLSAHPKREAITRRYLKHQPSLARQALARLAEEDQPIEEVVEPSSESTEQQLEKPLSLNEQRLGTVLSALKASGAKRVLDLGCGDGKLLREILKDKQFEEIVGMDVSVRSLEVAKARLRLDDLPARQKGRIRLLHGSLMYRDKRLDSFESPEEVEAAMVERVPLWNDKRDDHGPFDIIGDLHGCCDELESLLGELGYREAKREGNGSVWGTRSCRHPEGRKVVFLGDLVDRGPRILDILRLVHNMVAEGSSLCVPGNHDTKFLRKLRGKDVQIKHGLANTMAEFEALSEEDQAALGRSASDFLDGLVSHYVLDGGNLVVAHAGMKAEMQGRGSGKVREFALYGETTGETDEFGLPIRYNWAAEYRGRAMVIYGHTPVPEPEWLNLTVNIDTGCVFGGKLTALRYPEKEFVSVPAARTYCEPARPFLPDGEQAPSLSSQQIHDDLLDADDVLGKRIVSTRLRANVTIREEDSMAALEVMSRFAANPKWLIYLPPTMSPSETSDKDGFLEHPAEAFSYFRSQGVPKVVCEEKHMGSRAVVVICRNEEAARTRFGVMEGEAGIVYTRTGRRFFTDQPLETELLSRIRAAMDSSGFWEEFATDWACLDCELMPWSVKAQELLRSQYAAVGAAGKASLPKALEALRQADERTSNGENLADILQRYQDRHESLGKFIDAYRQYCWSVESIDDLKVAPFHLMATEGGVHVGRDHCWQMDTLSQICARDSMLMTATPYRIIDVTDPQSESEGIDWWLELTERGGEGMVVKPLDFIAKGKRGLTQPAVKCRGREYLRIIYGPDYTTDENLTRLRNRELATKRSLALREFALGIEALERFVRREPLRRVHECVFGVLALESEPVDPRL